VEDVYEHDELIRQIVKIACHSLDVYRHEASRRCEYVYAGSKNTISSENDISPPTTICPATYPPWLGSSTASTS
jgi:hypothetical protein